jgi:hypothetical protein
MGNNYTNNHKVDNHLLPRFMASLHFETHIGATQRVPLVEQELLSLPEHPSSSPVLVGFMLLDL